MVFGQFLDRMRKSREAGSEAERLMQEQQDAKAAVIIQEIEQQTSDIMAENQAKHDSEMKRNFEETLSKARLEVEEEYIEICKKISITGGEGSDTEIDSRRDGLPEKQKSEIINRRRRFTRKSSGLSLPILLTHFRSICNNHSQRISLYGEVPTDFIENCRIKRDEIGRLIIERQKELES